MTDPAAITARCRPALERIHKATGGSVMGALMLFSDLAGQAVPLPAVCQMLGVPESPDSKCTVEQFVETFQKGVDPSDNEDRLALVTSQHAASHEVMAALGSKLRALHQKVGGDFHKLKAFIDESAGQNAPEELLRQLFGIPPNENIVNERSWMGGFAQGVDPTDTAAKIEPVLDKHLAL